MEKYVNYLVEWLHKKVSDANALGLVVGLSGGIDSAVVASLIKKAFPTSSVGVILPCYSNDNDVKDALIVASDIGLETVTINLDKTYDALISDEISKKININSSFELSCANTKARLRMSALYAIAQNNNYLVCGTDNACEWHTGYFTKYGDGGVDISPLIQLDKEEVTNLAKFFGIDKKIIEKTPYAGLSGNQSDEEEMQVTYQELNAYLRKENVSLQAKTRIEYLHNISKHKRAIIDYPKKKVSDFK